MEMMKSLIMNRNYRNYPEGRLGASMPLQDPVYDPQTLEKMREEQKLMEIEYRSVQEKAAKLEVAFELLKHRNLTVDEALAMAEELAEKVGL